MIDERLLYIHIDNFISFIVCWFGLCFWNRMRLRIFPELRLVSRSSKRSRLWTTSTCLSNTSWRTSISFRICRASDETKECLFILRYAFEVMRFLSIEVFMKNCFHINCCFGVLWPTQKMRWFLQSIFSLYADSFLLLFAYKWNDLLIFM